MSKLDKIGRIKIFINHLIISGVADSQKAIGVRLGYQNESSFSQILTKKTPIPKNFIKKLKLLEPSLNVSWIEDGEGEMLKQESYSAYNKNVVRNTAGSNNQIIQGTASGVVFREREETYQKESISVIEKKYKARITELEAGYLLRLSEMEKKYEALLAAKDELIKEIKLQNERANKTIEKLCER